MGQVCRCGAKLSEARRQQCESGRGLDRRGTMRGNRKQSLCLSSLSRCLLTSLSCRWPFPCLCLCLCRCCLVPVSSLSSCISLKRTRFLAFLAFSNVVCCRFLFDVTADTRIRSHAADSMRDLVWQGEAMRRGARRRRRERTGRNKPAQGEARPAARRANLKRGGERRADVGRGEAV